MDQGARCLIHRSGVGMNRFVNRISTKQITDKEIKMYEDKEYQESILRISPLEKGKEVADILKISRRMAYNLY